MIFKVKRGVYAEHLEGTLNLLWKEGYRNLQVIEGGSRKLQHGDIVKFYTVIARGLAPEVEGAKESLPLPGL